MIDEIRVNNNKEHLMFEHYLVRLKLMYLLSELCTNTLNKTDNVNISVLKTTMVETRKCSQIKCWHKVLRER